VQFGKKLHGAIARLLDEVTEQAEFERVKMLSEYIARHERHLEESLASFEKNSRSGILEAWLEYSPDLDVDAVTRRCVIPDHPSSDDVVRVALDFDQALVDLYREVAEKVSDQKVKEVFRNLLALEEREITQVARAAMSFADM
jgi:rubrerythrin